MLCAVILISPAAWAHHYTLLLPASVLVAALSPCAYLEGRVHLAGPALALLAGLVMNLPFPFGWDTTPNAGSSLLLGVPIRPFIETARGDPRVEAGEEARLSCRLTDGPLRSASGRSATPRAGHEQRCHAGDG